jgi:nucleoside-diphosphate-sugar epimerase
MKIAITGATGFIGKYVVAELIKRSISPTVAIYPKDPIPESFKTLTQVKLDIKDPPANIYELLGKPDVLIHLAWGGLPNYKSLFHFEEELPSQYKFLSNLIKAGLKNLVVTGTCFEYGMQSGQLSESLETKPTNPYGFAKDALRKQLEYLSLTNPFSMTWTRLFYMYGDGQAPNSIYSQLKKAIDAKESTFNLSGGEQLRDYLPITELSSYLVSLALSGKNNGIVNICSGTPISIRTLVENWLTKNKWNIKLNLGYYPYPDYEPMAFWGDRRKLDLCLGKE